jgi:hypothetical protein
MTDHNEASEEVADLSSMLSDDIVDEHRRGRPLKSPEIQKLIARGVTEAAIDTPYPLRVVEVVFQPGGWFEFARHVEGGVTVKAITIPVASAAGLTDILAWQPETNLCAFWNNNVFALGEEEIWASRLTDARLHVWRSPWGWLRAGRRGLVIVRPQVVCSYLEYLPTLLAEDIEHGEELERMLTPPRPDIKILVPDMHSQTLDSEAA